MRRKSVALARPLSLPPPTEPCRGKERDTSPASGSHTGVGFIFHHLLSPCWLPPLPPQLGTLKLAFARASHLLDRELSDLLEYGGGKKQAHWCAAHG